MTTALLGLVVIPHLYVQNANAISSPMTYGFPALTAFTGAVHAIERRLNEAGLSVHLNGVGVICHGAELQTNEQSKYVTRFNLMRHPLAKGKEDDKTGRRSLTWEKDGSLKEPAVNEEGRMHLDISLVIGVEWFHGEPQHDGLAQHIEEQLRAMRVAGGSVLPNPIKELRKAARWVELPTEMMARASAFRKLTRTLLPGFAMVGRHGLLVDHLAALRARDSNVHALDALLDLCAVHWAPDPREDSIDLDTGAITENGSATIPWEASRRKPGWLVPIPVGYAAISDLYAPGVVARTRDPDTPFRFVEPVLSLGEWKSPHRLSGLDELLWHDDATPDEGLYLVSTALNKTALLAAPSRSQSGEK